ncbi:LysR family transcriptional regulator substrate-binding protein [Rhodococcus globerulus]|uniref:LysR family transcriptional regulator substrate-binding protein n=1 Tax=Rhodococcus globerulus TaxID=33008 RepID=UPI000A7D4A3E|nr:formate dehydrogenase accessory sulfurtransferase FdhD [Rhodococcus globerulus]
MRLGVVPTAAATAAELTGPLCIRHPLVTVHLAEDLASSDITTRIDRFELDGGITYLDDVTSRYLTFPLYREHYALLTADDPTLPRRIDISWQEASRLPMCTLPSIMRGRRILDEYFAAVMAGIPILSAVSAPSSLAVDLAAETGLTLIGFLRGTNMNLYTHDHRVRLGPAKPLE